MSRFWVKIEGKGYYFVMVSYSQSMPVQGATVLWYLWKFSPSSFPAEQHGSSVHHSLEILINHSGPTFEP